MLKQLAILGLWSCVLLGAAHSQVSASEKNPADNTKALASKRTAIPDNVSPTIVNQQSIQSGEGNQKGDHQPSNALSRPLGWLDWVNGVSTLVVAAFTALLFVGVILQINTSRDTERAWVIANPIEYAPIVGFIPEGGGNIELRTEGCNKQNVFSCSFKSTGNTPARLVEYAIHYRKVDRLEDIPLSVKYGQRSPLNDLPLVKEDTIGFAATLEPNPILSKAEDLAVTQQRGFLYAFGVVVYRDVYNRSHETRFGFVYHFPQGGDPREKGFRREGLPMDYNRAT